jgi:hypothetical protein
MIKLMDLLLEDKMPRNLSLGKLQVFSPGTGGDRAKFGMRLEPDKFPTGKLKVGMQMACSNKPIGGFWTSSYKQKFKGSEWTDYKKKNFKGWNSGIGAVFEIQGSPKIARIANWKQYEKLLKKYRHDVSDMGCRDGDKYLNWHTLSKDYDGFHLAMSNARMAGMGDWDVESVVWFNMSKLKFVGTIKV